MTLVGNGLIVLLAIIAAILLVLLGWVAANLIIREGLKIYKEILDLKSDVRDHEGRKKKS